MSLNWTLQSTPPFTSGTNEWLLDVACDGNGNTMAVSQIFGGGFNIYLSTNGGVSWTGVLHHATADSGSIEYDASTHTWVMGGETGSYPAYWVSTNTGTSWSLIQPQLTFGSNVEAMANDGNGHWIALNNFTNSPYIEYSSNPGTVGSWARVAIGSTFQMGTPFWDGSQFAAVVTDGSGNRHIYTSPTGSSWSNQGTVSPAHLVAPSEPGVNVQNCLGAYGGGKYILPTENAPANGSNQSGVLAATTISALLTANDIALPSSTSQRSIGTAGFTGYGPTLIYIAWISSAFVYDSPDASTWTQNNTFPSNSFTSTPAGMAYDSKNGVIIAVSGLNIRASGATNTVITAPFAPTPSLSISPTSVNVQVNGGEQQFTANEIGDVSTVLWSVNGILGGNATVGFIGGNGLYQAPQGLTSMPSQTTVTVTAATEDGLLSANATVTLTPTTVQAFGAFRGPSAFRPVSLTNVGSIYPKIYAPGENTTVKSQS
jgi:hypothetical protein